MEKLITCSRVLYDKDIIDKTEEIVSLKKSLQCYEEPKIEYSNVEEWETTKIEAYRIIKNGVDTWIIEEVGDYQLMPNMGFGGLTNHQRIYIASSIESALDLLTKKNNTSWSWFTSRNMINTVEAMIYGLIESGCWDSLYSDPRTVSDLIYNNIVYQLGDDGEIDGILDDVAIINSQCEIKEQDSD